VELPPTTLWTDQVTDELDKPETVAVNWRCPPGPILASPGVTLMDCADACPISIRMSRGRNRNIGIDRLLIRMRSSGPEKYALTVTKSSQTPRGA
jgi:hypothetical protein